MICLIRHTKVDVEPGICYGQSDVGLANFDKEKNKVADKIMNHSFKQVFSSPLLRCRKLAEYLFPDKEIIYDDKLKEQDFGDWEMKKWDDIHSSKEGKVWFSDYLKNPCPGGESYFQMIQRIRDFINSNQLKERKDNICIIVHGGVIRAFLSVLKNISPSKAFEDYQLDYGEVMFLGEDG